MECLLQHASTLSSHMNSRAKAAKAFIQVSGCNPDGHGLPHHRDVPGSTKRLPVELFVLAGPQHGHVDEDRQHQIQRHAWALQEKGAVVHTRLWRS